MAASAISLGRKGRENLLGWAFLFLIAWFGSDASDYVLSFGGPKPLYFYFVLLGVTAFYLLQSVGMARTLSAAMSDQAVIAFLVWVVVYAIWASLEYVNSTQNEVATQALITATEAALLTLSFLIMGLDAGRIRRETKLFLTLALLGSVIVVWDFLQPTFSSVPGRGAGFYENPNVAGSTIVLLTFAALPIVPNRMHAWYLGLTGAGVLVTFSRESWVMWAVGAITLIWARTSSDVRKRLFLVALVGGLGLVAYGGSTSGAIAKYVGGSGIASFLTPNTAYRMGIAATTEDFAARQREQMAWASIDQFEKRPWIGHGIGYIYEWPYPVGPHNMFLRFMVEGGMLGGLLFVALLLIIWHSSEGIGSILAMQLFIASLFSHNLLEMPADLILIAFIIAHGATTRQMRSWPTVSRSFREYSHPLARYPRSVQRPR